MYKMLLVSALAGAVCQGACANTTQNVADMTAAYNVASAFEAAYAANPKASPVSVKQAAALLSSAQAALLTWENAPAGSTAEATALSAAIAALVSFEAQLNQAAPAQHAGLDCDPTWFFCGPDGVHRGRTAPAVTDCSLFEPTCSDGVHRG